MTAEEDRQSKGAKMIAGFGSLGAAVGNAGAHIKGAGAAMGKEMKAMGQHADLNMDGVVSKQEIQSGVKEIFLYLLFVVLFSIVLHTQPIPESYFYSARLKDLFLGSEMDADYTKVFAKLYGDVLTEADFWQYVETPMSSNLWPSENPEENGKVLGQDILIGAVQLEAKYGDLNKGCNVPRVFSDKGLVMSCVTKDAPHTKEFILAQDWPRSQVVTEIRKHRDSLWIDRTTREVNIRFTVFNVNVDLFCNVELKFTFPIEGGIVPTYNFRTVALFRHLLLLTKTSALFSPSTIDAIYIFLEIVVIFFVFYFYYQEGKEMYIAGPNYFTSGWNIYDCFNLGIFGLVIILKLGVMMTLSSINFNPPANQYEDFMTCAYWIYQVQNWNSFNVVLTYLKIFKYLRLSPNLSQLMNTMGMAAADLVIILIFTGMLMWAYAQAFHNAFGMDIKIYSSLSRSFFTLFAAILGDFNLDDIMFYNARLGGVLFLTFTLLMSFFIVNMILAILDSAYGSVKQRQPTQDIFLATMQEWAKSKLMKRKKKNIEAMQSQIDAAASDGEVDLSELKEIMMANPEAAEIFKEFDQNGDGVLDEGDLKMMIDRFDSGGGGTLDLDEMAKIMDKLQGAKADYERREQNIRASQENSDETPADTPRKDPHQDYDEMLATLANLQVQMGHATTTLEDLRT